MERKLNSGLLTVTIAKPMLWAYISKVQARLG